MQNKITSERLVDDDVLAPLRKSAQLTRPELEALNLVLIDISKNASKELMGAVDPKNLVLLEKKAIAIDKINAAEKAQIKILNEKSKLAKEELDYKAKLAKQAQKEKDDKKALLEAEKKANKEKEAAIKLAKENLKLSQMQEGSLNQMRAKLNDLAKQYSALSAVQREDITIGGELITQHNKLYLEVEKLEQGMGNFHRNVGNYSGTLIKLGRGLAGVTGLVSTLGAAFGIDTSMLIQFHDVSKELIKTSRELHHATELEEVGHVKNIAAIEGEEFATYEDVTAKEKMILTEEAEGVARNASLGLIGLAIVALGALTVVVWNYITASEAEAERERQANVVKKAKIDLLIIQRKLEAQTAKEMSAIQNELLVAEGKMTEAQAKKSENQDKMAEQRDEIFAKTKKQLEELGEYTKESELQTYDERLKSLRQFHIYETEEQKRQAEKLGRLEGQSPDELFEKNIQNDPKLQILKAKDDAIRALQDNWDAEDAKVDADYKVKQITADKKHYEKQLSMKEKFLEEMRGGAKSDTDEEARNEKQGMDKLTKIKEQNEKEVEEEKKKQEEEYKLKVTLDEQKRHIQEEADKKAKELHDKQIDEEEKQMQDLLDLYDKYSDAKLERERKTLDRNNNNIESNLQVQAALMAKGEANTYSAVLKQQNENNLKQAAIDKKEMQRKEAMQIASIFLKFMDVYAKDGWAGIAKAAGATTATQLFADALAGKAYEGTEDTGNGSNMDEKGGALWMLHPHERVLSAQHNKMIGDLTNEELVQAVMMKDMYAPKMNVPENMQGNDLTIMRMFSAKIESLERTIKNKKEVQYAKNFVGETVRTEIENGIKKIYIDKRNRLRPNG